MRVHRIRRHTAVPRLTRAIAFALHPRVVMTNDLVHLAIWLLVLGGLPLFVAYVYRGERRVALAWLELIVGPMILGAVFLHAILFNVPNNFAVMKEYSFLQFWFKPQRATLLREFSTMVASLTVVGLVPIGLALFLSPRLVARARGEGKMVASFLLTVFTATILHHFPDVLLDAAAHKSWAYKSWDSFRDWPLPEAQGTLELSILPGAMALGFALLSLRAEAPPAQAADPEPARRRKKKRPKPTAEA